MKKDNLYINDFMHKLCRQRYDVNGNDLADECLQTLRDILPPSEFNEVLTFNNAVRSFEHLAMEEDVDIEDKKNIEAAQKYEALVDNAPIYPENKAALYDTLLGFIDINGGGNKRYMEVLRKKVDVIDKNQDAALNLAAKQAFLHNKGASREVYLNIMHRLFEKTENKFSFTFLSELGLVKDKNNKKFISAAKMTPQQRLTRLSVIQAIVKEPLAVTSRIPLLEEGLKLAENNLRHRNENFELKRDFSTQLQKDYYAIGDYAAGNKHALNINKWDRSFNLALEYGLAKKEKEYK